jgi:hypothetical protein
VPHLAAKGGAVVVKAEWDSPFHISPVEYNHKPLASRPLCHTTESR